MKNLSLKQFNLVFLLLVSMAIWVLLLWNHFNGGIPRHHILADENLPQISNAWGAVLIPVLVWLTSKRVEVRENLRNKSVKDIPRKVIVKFLAGLLFGTGIALFFTLGVSAIPKILILLILITSLFSPIYRAESLLGFVLGMTYTFGAVLPTGVGAILCLIGFLIYNLIRPALLMMINFLREKVS